MMNTSVAIFYHPPGGVSRFLAFVDDEDVLQAAAEAAMEKAEAQAGAGGHAAERAVLTRQRLMALFPGLGVKGVGPSSHTVM